MKSIYLRLIARIRALLLRLEGNRCRHDISLRNVAAAMNAYEVRVSTYTSEPPRYLARTLLHAAQS